MTVSIIGNHVLCTADDGAGGYVITEDFVKAMLQEFKEQRLIHRRFAFQILLEVCVLA